jgi:hypothetical protein
MCDIFGLEFRNYPFSASDNVYRAKRTQHGDLNLECHDM